MAVKWQENTPHRRGNFAGVQGGGVLTEEIPGEPGKGTAEDEAENIGGKFKISRPLR